MNPDRWRQIEDLCHELLRRPAAARSAFLETACAGDADLRAEVEALAANEPIAADFLESPARIEPGARLGAFEIQDLLGAGGMGEVYRARDTRLDRTVALKVLPLGMAFDPDRRSRFEQEARAISALNHPHICTLYDVGREAPFDFIVMEYLEGQTLADRLAKGAVPQEDALEYAAQIADALAAAHRQGVVHRDVKPANIMLTRTGAKLLDFGIAKLKRAAAAAGATARVTHSATTPGLALGTLPYMAPEQLEGKECDARSDLFSFGCVLYEMLTGRRAFPARGEPLQRLAPASLDRLVRGCLAVDPEARWQSAQDIARELRGIAADRFAAPESGTPRPRAWIAWAGWTAAAVLAVAAGLALLFAARARDRTAGPSRGALRRLAINVPGEYRPAASRQIAIARDGSAVAFVTQDSDGLRHLYLKRSEGVEATSVAGTALLGSPFFSPDGRWVGVFNGNKLQRLAIDGKYIESIADVIATRGGTWGPRGEIVFVPDVFGGLWLIPAAGGVPRRLTSPAPGEAHTWPEFLPGGDAVLFCTGSLWKPDVAVLSVRTGATKTLIADGTMPTYVDGFLVFARAGTLMAMPFNPATLATSGTPVPVMDGVMQTGESSAQFALTSDGTLVYAAGSVQPANDPIVSVDLNGVDRSIARDSSAAGRASAMVSPDGRQLTYMAVTNGVYSVFVFDIERQTVRRLTYTPTSSPVWSADGTHVTYASRTAPLGLFSISVDGGAREERLTTSSHLQLPASWSPDGQTLLFSELTPETGWDIWSLTPRAGGPPDLRPFLNTRAAETTPMFSPDGRWVAYTSDESGRQEIYIQPFARSGTKWQVSADGGLQPVWTRDGRTLFFRRGTEMLRAAVEPGASLVVHAPVLVRNFIDYRNSADARGWDVTPDGRHFVMPKTSVRPTATALYVVTDWLADVRAKVRQN